MVAAEPEAGPVTTEIEDVGQASTADDDQASTADDDQASTADDDQASTADDQQASVAEDQQASVAEHAVTCPVAWCPICATVGAVQPLKPDVVEHLLKAGTELFLAFRAVVDARADSVAGPEETPPARTTLEKIDLA